MAYPIFPQHNRLGLDVRVSRHVMRVCGLLFEECAELLAPNAIQKGNRRVQELDTRVPEIATGEAACGQGFSVIP